MTEKTIKKVCSCVNCGNEAEMAVTCTLESEPVSQAPKHGAKSAKVKGHGVCSSCGSEADMWLDLEEVTGI